MRSLRRGTVAIILVLAGGVLPRPANAQMSCASLAMLAVPATITSAAAAPDGASCRVRGVFAPSDGFEVWLPMSGWNGKFMGVANLAGGGIVDTPFGMPMALARGYATAGTDGGHVGGAFDQIWALGHPELQIELGYRANHVMAGIAKAIVEAFYGVPAAHSYFMGCSSGGSQALMEAQRYPQDYDGIVVGAPGNPSTHMMAAYNWYSRSLHNDPASLIPPSTLPAIADAVLARCDARDGLADGLLADPRRCHFNPARLRCKGGAADTCLTRAQIAGLRNVYRGVRTSNRKRVFAGWVPGGEVGHGIDVRERGPTGAPTSGGWETWVLGPSPLQHTIQNDFFRYAVFEDPAWDWRTFDVDRDLPITVDKLGTALDAADPDLAPFEARGGKMIMFQGWSDAAVSPLNTIADYERVVAVSSPRRRIRSDLRETRDFFRLFMAPGMHHCAGGPGPNEFDVVGALEQWVEHGIAPDRIVATHRTSGIVDRTRALCPYPSVARYDGRGSIDDAASFSCGRGRGRRR